MNKPTSCQNRCRCDREPSRTLPPTRGGAVVKVGWRGSVISSLSSALKTWIRFLLARSGVLSTMIPQQGRYGLSPRRQRARRREHRGRARSASQDKSNPKAGQSFTPGRSSSRLEQAPCANPKTALGPDELRLRWRVSCMEI